jgi:hypothetical protein
MHLPGFTAEASLNKPSRGYEATRDSIMGSKEEVIPQLPIILDCFCFRSFRYCFVRPAGGLCAEPASQRAIGGFSQFSALVS